MYEFNVAEQTKACVNWIKEWISKNGNDNTKVVINEGGIQWKGFVKKRFY